MTYLHSTTVQHVLRPAIIPVLPKADRQRLVVVPTAKITPRQDAPKPPQAPRAAPSFSPLIEEFLDDCGYSEA